MTKKKVTTLRISSRSRSDLDHESGHHIINRKHWSLILRLKGRDPWTLRYKRVHSSNIHVYTHSQKYIIFPTLLGERCFLFFEIFLFISTRLCPLHFIFIQIEITIFHENKLSIFCLVNVLNEYILFWESQHRKK